VLNYLQINAIRPHASIQSLEYSTHSVMAQAKKEHFRYVWCEPIWISNFYL